jgi:hypothetical protein
LFYVHFLLGEFATALSDAIFDLHSGDKEAWTQYLQQQGWSQDKIDEQKKGYWRRHCRVTVPVSGVVTQRVQAVFDQFAACVDIHTGKKRFTPDTYTAHKNQMKNIESGRISGTHCGVGACLFVVCACLFHCLFEGPMELLVAVVHAIQFLVL